MEPVPTTRPALHRRRLWSGLALLTLAVAAAGLAWYSWRPAPPTPPPLEALPLEPELFALLTKKRQDVLNRPRDSAAWATLGQVFLANELETEAGACFTEAARLDPAEPRWPYYLAGPLLNQGELSQALPLLERATAAGPVVYLRLAEAHLALGRLDEASAALDRAALALPRDPRISLDRGMLAVAREDWDAARSHLEACLGSPQARQKARNQLAFVAGRQGDLAAAAAHQAEAARLPKDADWNDPLVTDYLVWAVKKRGRFRLAEQLADAGNLPGAIAQTESLVSDFPDDYLPLLTLGKYLGKAGRPKQAEGALRRARELAPGMVQCHYYLGLVLYSRAEEALKGGASPPEVEPLLAEATALARQALVAKPDYGYAHMVVGLASRRRGKPAEATEALAQAVRCNPEVGELHFYLGEVQAEQGQGSQARTSLTHAVRLAEADARWLPRAREILAKLPAAP